MKTSPFPNFYEKASFALEASSVYAAHTTSLTAAARGGAEEVRSAGWLRERCPGMPDPKNKTKSGVFGNISKVHDSAQNRLARGGWAGLPDQKKAIFQHFLKMPYFSHPFCLCKTQSSQPKQPI